jgi:hypothetical protein
MVMLHTWVYDYILNFKHDKNKKMCFLLNSRLSGVFFFIPVDADSTSGIGSILLMTSL